MKKIAIIASVIASVLVLASCSNEVPPPSQQVGSPVTHSAGHHHDYKGEG
jgi:PBP1b-binding outer membrane lipoprotein LpoB